MKIISGFVPRRKGDSSGKIDSFSQTNLYKKTKYADVELKYADVDLKSPPGKNFSLFRT